MGLVLGAMGAFYYAGRTRAPASSAEIGALPAPVDSGTAAPTRLDTATRTSPAGGTPSRRVLAALAERPGGTAERAALYDAASRANLSELEVLQAEAATIASETTRAFALDVLITRHGELDPAGAIAAAEHLQLPAHTLTNLYYAWLKSSSTAAIDHLRDLDEAKAMMIASGLVSMIGDDELLVNRILAAVPQKYADSLKAASLARLARDSPEEAFARAKEIGDPAERDNALSQVLFAWVERDPAAVLQRMDELEPAMQSRARDMILARLAQREPREALRYLEQNGSAAKDVGLWHQIASSEPALVLERLDAIPLELKGSVERAAIQSLAQRDPQAAIARLEQTPPGPARQQLVQVIARSYAERDANGALAWARSLQPAAPDALPIVLSTIASKEPMRAIDLASEIATPVERTRALQAVAMSAAMQDPSVAKPLLERMLALPNDAQRQNAVQSVVSIWASRAPVDAAEWLLSNSEHAPPEAVAQVAVQFARLDAPRAAAFAARLPGDARSPWLRGVASAYAASDPRAAITWVEQFRGSPEYDDTAIAVLQSAAQYDPVAAARLFETIDRAEYRRSAAGTVAMQWASQDPAAAAAWVSGLRDDGSRMGAMAAVTNLWVTRDAPAARAWVMSQPVSGARDGAVSALVSMSARVGAPDTSLLDAFSTEQARLGGVQGAALGIALRDPDEARRFIESNVAAGPQRDRMLQAVTQITTMRSRVGPGMVPPPGMIGSTGFVPPVMIDAGPGVSASQAILTVPGTASGPVFFGGPGTPAMPVTPGSPASGRASGSAQVPSPSRRPRDELPQTR
jgi:hypothetical protein